MRSIIKTIVSGIVGNVRIVSGMDRVSSATKRRRLIICSSCSRKAKVVNIAICLECGCPVRSKVLLRGSRCPLKLWTPRK